MIFAGTISLPEEVFELILEYSARSLKMHGFKTILFLGDSGGNQDSQAKVAEKLNNEWRSTGVATYHISDYYSGNGQVQWLQEQGYSDREIGNHAGIRDTSELLAIRPDGVRLNQLRADASQYSEATGSNGDPTLASAEIGRVMLEMKISAALRQIYLLQRHSQ